MTTTNKPAPVQMTKGNAIRYYRRYNGSDGYILGFEYKHQIYMAIINGHLMPRWIKVHKMASSQGGKNKLQLNLTNKYKEELIRKGAELIDFVPNHKNNGRAFEMYVQNRFNAPVRNWDADGFWVGGDVNIDGVEYQVKFGNAQIVVFETLKNLQACGKDWRNYKPVRGKKKGA